MKKMRCFNIILQCVTCHACERLEQIDEGAFTDLVVAAYDEDTTMGYPCMGCDHLGSHTIEVCAHDTREEW